MSRGLVAVPLLASACGGNVEEASDIVLARHVHTDLYDAHASVLVDRAGEWAAPVRSPDGRAVAVTLREAAIEVMALAAGSTGANSNQNQERT